MRDSNGLSGVPGSFCCRADLVFGCAFQYNNCGTSSNKHAGCVPIGEFP